MILSTLRVNSDNRHDASPDLPGPSGKCPYVLPVGSHAPTSPVPTLYLGPYVMVTLALSLYLMVSASSFCGQLRLARVRVVCAPPPPWLWRELLMPN